MPDETKINNNALITLSWENLNVYTPDPNDGFFAKIGCCKPKGEQKHIIKNGWSYLIKNFMHLD